MDARKSAMWAAVGVQASASIINIFFNPLCFILWGFANIVLIENSLRTKEYYYSLLFVFWLVMDFYGYYHWIGLI